MRFSKEIISDALSFYSINDNSYLNRCLECFDYVIRHNNLMTRVKELMDVLYNKRDYLLAKLWKVKSNEELFCNNYHPFITNIIVLLGYKLHQENMKKYNLDDEKVFMHKKRVKEALTYDIYERGYDGIRISQMLWASYFINLRIIEVGSLQYELVDVNPVTKKKERCIKIHIPKNTKLDIKGVKQSLRESKNEVLKYFKINNMECYCESWLLSKEVLKLLDSNSNILKFSKLFDIISGSDCKKDILNFVFNETPQVKYETLKVNTSLQRKLKNLLLNNGIIKIGIGRLKEDIL